MALSFLNNPHGYLGTDTGGKVATLRVMDARSKLDPDLGYWAERWDPEGRLHPLYYTAHLHGKWVNVTTLPALYAAYPLFRLAGYRGALLVPMAGAVLAALAARALARRLGAGEHSAWAAFWIVGLASPLAIYALDFWEHTLGVALVAWAVVLLLPSADGELRWSRALAAGLLFGAAATMRTEALVYGAVATAAVLLVTLWRNRKLVPVVLAGAAVLVGLVVPLAANVALERATIGTGLRAERAAGTVRGAVSGAGQSRLEEALLTGLALQPDFAATSYVLGAALLALLLLFARRAARIGDERRVAAMALTAVTILYLLRFVDGLGFVPGLIAATPLAAVGLAWAWTDPARRLLAGIALAALPLVWATQFTGGAAPQWAGRYILTSGYLLGVLGVVALPLLHPRAAIAAAALAGLVTAFGLAWLAARSHDVGDSAAALARRPEPVLVSRVAHLAREDGWYYLDRRWLTAVNDGDVSFAADVVRQAGFDRFGLVEAEATSPPPVIVGFTPIGSQRQEFLSGVQLRITTYSARGV